MLSKLKQILYFPIAGYFRFFAGIRLQKWKPRVIVVTGSSGKTTLLHMLEAQLGGRAIYSHHANSAYGIPFFILDLHRKSLKSFEWLKFFLYAPINALKRPPEEKIFVVEADTDRWGEGRFLAEFLKPEVVLWTSVSRTHGMNFENINKFKSMDEAIAFDFGYFLEYCSKLAIINADSELVIKQIKRTKAKVVEIKKKEDLDKYELQIGKTEFQIRGEKFSFNALLPEEIFYSIVMCREVCGYFQLPFDKNFSRLNLPPGRSSIFRGIKNIIIIDSSYNANLSSMRAVLNMFDKMPGKSKWVVVGDMLELGEKEKEEHEKLGELLAEMDLERVILVGERVGRYTYEILDQKSKIKNQNQNLNLKTYNKSKKLAIEKFSERADVLDYIKRNIGGGEMVLFKGSQSLYLEGVIEKLLANKEDIELLPRRGEFWERRRRS